VKVAQEIVKTAHDLLSNLHEISHDLHQFVSAATEILSIVTDFVLDSPDHHSTFIASLLPVTWFAMENPIHVQLRAAREAHGLTQHELAARAGVGRSDIQRLERGDNVGIRLLEKVLAQLPDLTTFQMGGIEVTGRITVDVDSVRQIVLDIVAAGTQALQVLEQARPAERPETVGATRYERKTGASRALKEHLRRIDPTYQASKEDAVEGDRPRVELPKPPDSEH
jgi:transcriptional regulator with XRE-family HTH domain